MSRISKAAGNVICEAIKSADIVYKDKDGAELLVVPLGFVSSGGEIKTMVPVPENISILISPP